MNLSEKSILVVGDIMLDVYYVGDVDRISPEAPVPVFRKRSERCVLGGAANVASNLVAAGQKVSLMAIVGKDAKGAQIHGLLGEKNIDDSMVLRVDRPTTTKTRFLAGSNQQVLRFDEEDVTPIEPPEEDALLSALTDGIRQFDAVLVSDYMKGLLTPRFTQAVIALARESGVDVFVDVKDSDASKYAGAKLVKPNLNELKTLTGMPASTRDEVLAASRKLLEICSSEYVLSTLGGKGMMLVSRIGDPVDIPAVGKEVFDVTGAGDTAIAYLVACYADGRSMRESMEIANVASGIQISKVGTSSVYPEEVQAAIDGLSSDKQVKERRIDLKQASCIRSGNVGRTIVFTNGCFDILHVGHVRYLRQAASLGDLLVVGVNSDSSVRKLKGRSRPINPVEDRVQMLASFDFVDYVIVFDEDTPYEVIKAIQPDILVKGGDYSLDQIVGRDIVEARGGEVRLIPFIEGKSSTSIIEKILAQEGKR